MRWETSYYSEVIPCCRIILTSADIERHLPANGERAIDNIFSEARAGSR